MSKNVNGEKLQTLVWKCYQNVFPWYKIGVFSLMQYILSSNFDFLNVVADGASDVNNKSKWRLHYFFSRVNAKYIPENIWTY